MKFTLTSFLIVLFSISLFGQQIVIEGKVKDENGRALSDVFVGIVNSDNSTISSSDGSYSISADGENEVLVEFRSVGYDNQIHRIAPSQSRRSKLNIDLVPTVTAIEEILITGSEQDREKVSTVTIDEEMLENLPAVTGGVETLIKTLPGVSSRNELSSQYAVRGGSYDENLVYINGFEIYRPQLIRSGQQEGLSIINPDMTRNIYFSAGGFEPQYGDKMSSVLDINYKQPNSMEGSAYLGLLGGGTQIGNSLSNGKLDYLIGGRFHTNKYLLNSLEDEGAYNPYSYDLQGVIGVNPNENSRLELLAYAGRTVYDYIPSIQNSSFGTISQVLTFSAIQDGSEKDVFRNSLIGLSYSTSPQQKLNLKFSASLQDGDESETIDILSQYYLGEESTLGGGTIDTLVQGFQFEKVDNELESRVLSIDHNGILDVNDRNFLAWGLSLRNENFTDRQAELKRLDTVNFQAQVLGNVFFFNANGNNEISQNKYSAFLQNTYLLNPSGNSVITAGVRGTYSDFSEEFLISPRLQFSHRPDWQSDIVFRTAAGLYHQPTFYRDVRRRDGSINNDINAQKSFQVIGGADLNFQWRDLPMKFTAEAYYKNMWDVIPYEYDVIRIRYLGDNLATANSSGVDFRLNGEFVEDAESWLSVSYLKTEEDIEGQGTVRRPQDQRINVSLLFQDYFPNNENFRVKLVGLYGSNVPTGLADGDRTNDDFEIPSYKRMDVGFAANLKGRSAQRLPNHPFEKLRSVWLTAEVFNMFNIDNTASYNYVYTPEVVYAVPNDLTARRLNAKLTVKF